jgi:uncharacterized protein YndB with AHSA1/START domain
MTPQTVEPVIVKRKLRAPRSVAFRTWIEPDCVRQWIAGPCETCSVVSLEARPGGAFRFAVESSAASYCLEGSFVEIDPPKSLVLNWRRTGFDPDPAVTRVTVLFHELEQGTEIEVRHEMLADEEAAERSFQFWVDTLTRFSSFASMQNMMEEYSMSTTLETPTGWAGKIADEKAATMRAIARFNDTFSFVPDDKLDYRPAESCKTPVRLAAHVAASNRHFASVLRGDPQEHSDLPAIFAALEAEETKYSTKEAALAFLADSNKEVLDAFDRISIDALASNPQLQFYVGLPAYHIANHAAQIDYIQTTWGDLNNHFGM